MATTTLYQQWADAFASVGECHLSLDTCCKLLAVVYVCGGEDASFTHNMKLVTDWRAAARRLNISGGETPDPEGHALLRKYIGDLEEDVAKRSRAFKDLHAPCTVEWANRLFAERYNIKELHL